MTRNLGTDTSSSTSAWCYNGVDDDIHHMSIIFAVATTISAVWDGLRRWSLTGRSAYCADHTPEHAPLERTGSVGKWRKPLLHGVVAVWTREQIAVIHFISRRKRHLSD
jgi:hypothetical protein